MNHRQNYMDANEWERPLSPLHKLVRWASIALLAYSGFMLIWFKG